MRMLKVVVIFDGQIEGIGLIVTGDGVYLGQWSAKY
jgi:hypothetical protein